MENENDIYGVGLKGVALWCFSVSMVNGVWTLSMCDEAVSKRWINVSHVDILW